MTEKNHPPDKQPAAAETLETWAVSAVMTKDSREIINVQHLLYQLQAVSREEAKGKGLEMAQKEFPQHQLFTICAMKVVPPGQSGKESDL